MSTFKDLSNDKIYKALVAKYETKLKAAIAKVDAVNAEMALARDKFAVKPPADASGAEKKEYAEHCNDTIKMFQELDRYMSKVKSDCKELLASVKLLRP